MRSARARAAAVETVRVTGAVNRPSAAVEEAAAESVRSANSHRFSARSAVTAEVAVDRRVRRAPRNAKTGAAVEAEWKDSDLSSRPVRTAANSVSR